MNFLELYAFSWYINFVALPAVVDVFRSEHINELTQPVIVKPKSVQFISVSTVHSTTIFFFFWPQLYCVVASRFGYTKSSRVESTQWRHNSPAMNRIYLLTIFVILTSQWIEQVGYFIFFVFLLLLVCSILFTLVVGSLKNAYKKDRKSVCSWRKKIIQLQIRRHWHS